MGRNILTLLFFAGIVFISSCTKDQACGTPTGLKISYVNYFSAYPVWDSVSGAKSYTLRYRKVGSNAWTTNTPVTTNQTEILPLDSVTNYEWQVQSKCANGVSAFSPSYVFSTIVPVGYWTFRGNTIIGAVANVDTSTRTIVLSDGMAIPNDLNFLSFTFSNYPTVSGTYRAVSRTDNSTGNTVLVRFFEYYSTGNDNVSITVSVANGKLSFSIPSVEVSTGIYTTTLTNIKVNQQ